MKKNILITTLLILIGFASSCSSDDSSSNNTTNSESTISATINGQSWSSIQGGALASVTTAIVDGENKSVIQIVGAKLDQSVLTLQLPLSSFSQGTYTFSTDGEGMMSYFNPSTLSMYSSTAGTGSFTLTITNFNLSTGNLSGTFSGTLYSNDSSSITVSNGVIDNVKVISSEFYSNGSMSLKRNNGQIFTMDADNSDGKFVMISQNSELNSIEIFGNNANLGSDFGIYTISLPSNATPGTYNVMTNSNYKVGLGNGDNEPEYNITSGSITVTSHVGKSLVGTFNFVANNGQQTVNISNGSYSVEHK